MHHGIFTSSSPRFISYLAVGPDVDSVEADHSLMTYREGCVQQSVAMGILKPLQAQDELLEDGFLNVAQGCCRHLQEADRT